MFLSAVEGKAHFADCIILLLSILHISSPMWLVVIAAGTTQCTGMFQSCGAKIYNADVVENKVDFFPRTLKELDQDVVLLKISVYGCDTRRISLSTFHSSSCFPHCGAEALIATLYRIRIIIRNIYSVIFQTQETSAKTITGRCRRGHLEK